MIDHPPRPHEYLDWFTDGCNKKFNPFGFNPQHPYASVAEAALITALYESLKQPDLQSAYQYVNVMQKKFVDCGGCDDKVGDVIWRVLNEAFYMEPGNDRSLRRSA
jgi:hypothetical protein